MPEPPNDYTSTALRYAARDLPPGEAAAFESCLAGDQSARDALAEAVRLSAAALGQESPSPDRSFRSLIRERLRVWHPRWLARRVYRGHPLAWAGIGAGIVAACTLFALHLSAPGMPQEEFGDHRVVVVPAPETPRSAEPSHLQAGSTHDDGNLSEHAVADSHDDSTRKAAEIWAELSTPDHVERTHDDEARLHQRLKHLHSGHPNHPPRPTTGIDSNEP